MLQNSVELVDNFLATQTVATDVEALEANAEGDYTSAMVAAANTIRARLAAAPALFTNLIGVIFLTYARHVVGTPELDATIAFERTFQYYVDNSKYVQARGFTFAVPGSWTGTGTGGLDRLNVDENGFPLEAQTPDAKTATCIQDATSGALKHEEVFELRGAARGKDFLSIAGSGATTRINAKTANQSILSNPSFSQYAFASGTPIASTPAVGAANDTLNDWTVTDFTAVELDVDQFPKDISGDTTPTSLNLTANVTLTQTLAAANVQLDFNRPYRLIVWARRENSCDGTLTLTWGSKTQVFTITSQTNDTWEALEIDLDADCWPKNFNTTDPTVAIALASRTTGNIHIDEVMLVPLDLFDGGWYINHGGLTKYLVDDTLTFTDAVPSDSKIQKWCVYRLGRYLPAALTAPGASTAALAGLGAGNVEDGNHSWKVTFVDLDLVESGGGTTSNVLNVTDKSTDGQVALTGVPTGAANITARKIYRTVAGDTGSYLLVGTISDNVTTTFADNIADGSLGAAAPTGITIADPT
mgnify:CR=1 FL=1